jgi:6-phosphogluconolactonase
MIRMKSISKLCFPAAVLALASLVQASPKSEYFVYVGTYTGGNSKGIYGFRFHPSGGTLEPMGLMAETVSPSFVAVSPNHKFLYAVNEIDDFGGQKAGSVSAFAIDGKTGKLTFLNQVSSRGGAPCHVSVDKTGKTVLVANYNGGSVAAFPVKDDGRLGEASAFVQHAGSSVDKSRQEGPHAHSFYPSLDNRFAIAGDLGLDEVVVYKLDAANSGLTANDPPFAKVPPGGGPRHFAFHPSAKFGYTNNEMTSSVTAFTYDAARGALTSIQTISTLPQGFSGNNSTAEIFVHPNGKTLYVSNRGHNSIAVFAIDAKKGTLTALEQVSTQGKTPRGFAIDPTGGYLLAGNQDTDNIMIFRIDPKSGRLKAGKLVDAPKPVSIAFVPVAAK